VQRRSRVLIQDSIYDSFTADLARRFRALRVGAAAQDLDLGPVVNAQQKKRIESYVDIARRDGLTILAEGELGTNVPANGSYVKPTLIGGVRRHEAVRPGAGEGHGGTAWLRCAEDHHHQARLITRYRGRPPRNGRPLTSG